MISNVDSFDNVSACGAWHNIVEKETKTEAVHQGYIEPQTSTVRWGSDGYLQCGQVAKAILL